jgi:hypothetical protein
MWGEADGQGRWYAFHRSRLIVGVRMHSLFLFCGLRELDLILASMRQPLPAMVDDQNQNKTSHDTRTNQARLIVRLTISTLIQNDPMTTYIAPGSPP